MLPALVTGTRGFPFTLADLYVINRPHIRPPAERLAGKSVLKLRGFECSSTPGILPFSLIVMSARSGTSFPCAAVDAAYDAAKKRLFSSRSARRLSKSFNRTFSCATRSARPSVAPAHGASSDSVGSIGQGPWGLFSAQVSAPRVVVEDGASDEKLLRWEMDGGNSNQQLVEPLSGEQGEMGRWLGEAGRWLSDPWP
jgi:hypothetical protein